MFFRKIKKGRVILFFSTLNGNAENLELNKIIHSIQRILDVTLPPKDGRRTDLRKGSVITSDKNYF